MHTRANLGQEPRHTRSICLSVLAALCLLPLAELLLSRPAAAQAQNAPRVLEVRRFDSGIPGNDANQRQADVQARLETTNRDTLAWRVRFNRNVNIPANGYTQQGANSSFRVIDEDGNLIPNVNFAIAQAENGARTQPARDALYITASGGPLADYSGEVKLALKLRREPVIRFVGSAEVLPVTAFNMLGAESEARRSYTLDNTDPTVRITALPSTGDGADSINALDQNFSITVTFDEPVAGFAEDDIDVDNGAVASVMPQREVDGFAQVWTVQIDPNDALADDAVISIGVNAIAAQDKAGNVSVALANPAQVTYNAPAPVDPAPMVASVTRVETRQGEAFRGLPTSPTNANDLRWRITFNEDVQNVDVADFDVTGADGADLAVVGESATVYEVTASGPVLENLNGNVTLQLEAGQDISDTANGALADDALTSLVGENQTNLTYTVDNAPPTIAAVTRRFADRQGEAPSPTNADRIAWTIETAPRERLRGFDPTDFQVAGSGTVTQVVVEPSGIIGFYKLIASGNGLDDFTGDVRLELAPGHNITDEAGNRLANDALTSLGNPSQGNLTFVLDNTGPSITAIERENPRTSPTNEDTLVWSLEFSKAPLAGSIDAADFQVAGGSSASVTAVAQQQGGPTFYSVTVDGGDLAGFTGNVTLELSGNQNITDALGNALDTRLPDTVQGYALDNVHPTVSLVRPPAAVNAGEFEITVNFTKEVENFMLGNAAITNGDVSTAPTAVAPVNGRAENWKVGITPDGNGPITINIPENAAQDAVGNQSQALAPAAQIAYDTTRPTVQVARQVPMEETTNADTLTWRLTFSKPMNPASLEFSVSGANRAVSDGLRVVQVAGEPLQYDVIASGGNLATFNGNVSLQAVGRFTDTVGNELTGGFGGQRVYILDNVRPTVSLAGLPAGGTVGALAPLDITVQFSKPVDAFVEEDLTIARATVAAPVRQGGANDSPQNWTVTITPDDDLAPDEDITINIAENVVRDAVGNGNDALAEVAVRYTPADRVAPTIANVTRQAPATSPTNADELTWRIEFSKAVQILDVFGGFRVTGAGDVDLALRAEGDRAYTVTASAGNLARLNGAVTLERVPGTVIRDDVNNPLAGGFPAGAELTYEVDNTPPVLTIENVPALTNEAFTATFRFVDAAEVDFAANAITGQGINVDAASFTAVQGEANTWTARITPQAENFIVRVVADAVTDAAGNGNAEVERRGVNDTLAPTVTEITAPDTVGARPFNITVEFNEAVENFQLADDAIGNGTVSTAPAPVNQGAEPATNWTVGITPDAGIASGSNITINIPAGAAQDPAGNGNLEAEQNVRENVAYDNVSPVPTIAGVPEEPTNAAFNVTISFDKALRAGDLLVAGDIGGDNIAVSAFTAVAGRPANSPPVWTALITPQAEGRFTVTVAADAVADALNNGSLAAEEAGTYDTRQPQVQFTARAEASATSSRPLAWNVGFNEALAAASLQGADFQLLDSNGDAIDNVQIDFGNIVINAIVPFNVRVSADGDGLADFDGEVTLALAPGQDITDLAGNPLAGDALENPIGIPDERSYDLDTVAPTVSLPNLQATVGAAAFNLAVEFSEPVDGFAADDLVLTNAAVTMGEVPEPADPNDPAPTRNWTVSITPDGMGDISINIPAGAAQDAVDNDSAALAAAEQVAYDGNLPTLQITGVPQAAKEPFTATFTFDKAVLGFEANDIIGTNVAGAGVSAFTETTPGEVWTALITPQADGDFTVEVAAGAATDNLGNPNAQAQAPGTYDTVAPTVSISNPPATVGAGEFELTVEFSEAVGNFQLEDAAITDGTVTTDPEPADPAAVVDGRTSNWKVGITPTDGLASPGTITINIPAAAAQDAAGNDSAALPAVQDIAYDATRPTVMLAGVPAGTDNLAAFDITVTFGVAVSGFEAADLALTNAAVTAGPTAQNADAAGRATEWAVTLTPTAGLAAGSNIEIAIPENAAQSATGSQSLPLASPELVAYNPPAAPPPQPGAVPPRGAPGVVQGGAGAAPAAPPGEVTLRIQSSDAGTVTFESSTAALAGSVNVSAAAAGSFGPISLPAGDYAVNYRLPAGFAVLEASCEAEGSQIDVAEGNIALNVSAGQSLECSLSLQNNQMAATAQVETLLDDRAQLVQSQRPNPSRRLGRLQGRSSATTLSLGGRQAAAAGTLPFDLLLDQERLQLGYSRMATPADEVLAALPALDLWFEVTLGKYRAGQGKGRYGIVHAGVDTLLSDDWLVGVGISGDRLTQSRSSEASGYRSTGWLLGPYVTGRLYQNLYVDMQLSGGMASNTLSPTWGGTSEFDSSRFYGALSLFGDFSLGKLAITPKVSGSWYREKSKSYTDSYGIAIPSAVMRNGALETGLRMSHTQDDGRSSQYLEIDGIWNLDGSSAQDQRLRIGLGGTLAAPWLGGSLEGGVRFDGIGADNWQDTAVHLGYRSRPGLLFGGSLETGLDMTGIAAQALGLRIGFTRPERIFGGAFSSDLSLAPQGSAESFRLQLNYEVRF